MLSIDRDPQRGGYVLRASTIVPRPIDEVFAFFSDALNLEKMTPPSMGFRVLTPPPIAMRVGLLIDYRVKVLGVPVRWQSKITAWEPGVRFADVQTRGPFRYWEHQHTFEPVLDDAGNSVATRVGDYVEYGVPGGALVHWLQVRPTNERVFAHRTECLEREFGPPPTGA
ncbi:MAG: SRPBCC family protein [Lacipirellulaceae bacterium]